MLPRILLESPTKADSLSAPLPRVKKYFIRSSNGRNTWRLVTGQKSFTTFSVLKPEGLYNYLSFFRCICGRTFVNLETNHCKYRQSGEGRKNLVEASLNVDSGKFKLIRAVHSGTVLVYQADLKNVTLESFSATYEYMYKSIETLVQKLLEQLKGIKISIRIYADLKDLNSDRFINDRQFFTPFLSIMHPNYIRESVLLSASYAIKSLNLYQENGSGWALASINKMEAIICQYISVKPRGYLPTTKSLCRGTIYNIKNKNESCFLLSELCSLYRSEIKLPGAHCDFELLTQLQKKRLKRLLENPKSYDEIIKRLLVTKEINIEPFLNKVVSLDEIEKFEQLNGISVSVFAHEGKNLIPIRFTSMQGARSNRHVNLLLLNCKDDPKNYHYACIPNIGRFLGKANNPKRNYCNHCMQPMGLHNKKHEAQCSAIERRLICHEDTFVSFKHFKALQDHAFKVIYKIECYTIPIQEIPTASFDKLRYCKQVSDLRCASYYLLMVGPTNQKVCESYYEGDDAMEHFFAEIFKLQQYAFAYVKNMIPLHTAEADELRREMATHCPVCKLPFDAKRIKTRHHNHVIPNHEVKIYCSECNLKAQQRPIVFIGHSSFDSQIILKSLKREIVKASNILVNGGNEIISFTLRMPGEKSRCTFRNFNRFVQEDLQTLVKQLKNQVTPTKWVKKFPITLGGLDGYGNKESLLQELPFPNKCFYGPEVLKHTTFPSIQEYRNRLTDQPLPAEHYENAKQIYYAHCETLGDYLRLYLKVSCHLLADVIVNFSSTCFKNFGLFPLHFNGLAGYAFSCTMLHSTEMFQKIPSEEIFYYVKPEIKGGASISATKFAQSNTERIGTFNPSLPRTELLFLDCNSMYPTQLLNYLAFSNYELIPDNELCKLNIAELPDDTGIGWILEVDASYPEDIELMDRDHYFPLGISHRSLDRQDLSAEQQIDFDRLSSSKDNPFKKSRLSMDFHPKKGLKVYYKLLKYYISRGLRIDRVVSGLRFKEKPFLRDFITLCIKLREKAILEGDLVASRIIKSLANSIWGKLLSDSSQYTNTKVCVSRADALKIIAKPTFQNLEVIDDDMTLFQMQNLTYRHDFNIVAAFICLDLAKLEAYRMYSKLQTAFPNSKLIFHETDSFMIECPDPDKNFVSKLKSLSSDLDLSECEDPNLYSLHNKGKPGKWKVQHQNLKEVCSIRSKTYSLLFKCPECGSEADTPVHKCQSIVKASGVPSACLTKLNHYHLKDLLSSQGNICVNSKSIRSKNLSVGVYENSKLGISAFNFSRYENRNKNDTTARGHLRLLRGEKL